MPPLLAAGGALIGALGGASVVVPAAVGIGSALYSGSQQKKATKQTLAANTQANDKALAEQKAARDQIAALNEPFRAGGLSAFQRLLQEYGLDPNGGPAAGGIPSLGQPRNTAPQGEWMTQGGGGLSAPPTGGKTPGGFAGVSPLEPQGQSGGYDFAGYVSGNPDLQRAFDAYSQGQPPSAIFPDAGGKSWQDYGYGPGLDAASFGQSHFQNTGGEGHTPPAQLPAGAPAPPQAPTPSDPATDLMNAPRPEAPPAPSYQRPAEVAAPTFNRPADQAAPTFGNAPDMQSYLKNFQADPSYQFRLKEGLDAANTGFAARGLLKSGAAAKGIAGYASDLASQEYGNFFNRGMQQYDRARQGFDTDRNFGQNAYQYGQNRADNNFTSDRSYGTNRWADQRDRADRNFSEDRGFTEDRNRYDTNRGDVNFNADRGYQAGRYDTRIGNLFSLANIGKDAAGAVGGATSNYANNAGNIFGSQANAASDAANSRAQANSGMFGAVAGTAANLFNAYAGGLPRTTPITPQFALGSGGLVSPQYPQSPFVSTPASIPRIF